MFQIHEARPILDKHSKKILRSSLSAASEIFLKLQKYKISNKIGYILWIIKIFRVENIFRINYGHNKSLISKTI